MDVEVLVKVGTNQKYEDGMIIDIKRPGVLITPADINSYITTGTVPASVQSLPRWKKQQLKQHILEVRTINQLSPGQLKNLFPNSIEDVAEAQAIKDKNSELITLATTHGIDTNWGFEELKKHVAIAVTGAPDDSIEEFRQPVLDEVTWPAPEVKRRGWYCFWRSFVTLTQRLQIEDPNTLWSVKRGSAISYSQPGFISYNG